MMDEMGATGKFPEGKLNERDEGELQFRVGTSEGTVILDFGTPVVWLGTPPDKAREVAQALLIKADEAEAWIDEQRNADGRTGAVEPAARTSGPGQLLGEEQ